MQGSSGPQRPSPSTSPDALTVSITVTWVRAIVVVFCKAKLDHYSPSPRVNALDFGLPPLTFASLDKIFIAYPDEAVHLEILEVKSGDLLLAE